MKDERPVAEEHLGLFYSPSTGQGDSGILVPTKPLHVGPGEPGPDDEWHLPPLPADEAPKASKPEKP